MSSWCSKRRARCASRCRWPGWCASGLSRGSRTAATRWIGRRWRSVFWMRRELNSHWPSAAALFAAIFLIASPARAIDLYEIQIYSTETTPQRALELELHSNSVTTATGAQADADLRPYEIHETLEASYGLPPHIEIGQYFCTAKLENGHYEYSGSRSKVHFGIAATDDWPVQFGGNIELDYMRRAADPNPLGLELRPIIQTHLGKFWLIANFA